MRSILLHSLLDNEVKVISMSSIPAYKYKKKTQRKTFDLTSMMHGNITLDA